MDTTVIRRRRWFRWERRRPQMHGVQGYLFLHLCPEVLFSLWWLKSADESIEHRVRKPRYLLLPPRNDLCKWMGLEKMYPIIPYTRRLLMKRMLLLVCAIGIAEKHWVPRVRYKWSTARIVPARELARTWTCVRVTVAWVSDGFVSSMEVKINRALMSCLN